MDRRLAPPPALPGWLTAELPAERCQVELPGVRLHVVSAGPADGLPVVLLHGNPTWSYLWRRVASLLADAPLRLVMPDLVGLGFSDKPPASAHRLESHSAWVRGALEALGIDRFVFVGQDWGGPIGLHLLAQEPQRALGLVILNTAIGPPREGFRPTFFHRLARWPLLATLLFRGLGFPQCCLHRAQGDPASIRGEVARAYRFPLRGWRRRAAPLALARMVPDSLQHPSVAPLAECEAFVTGFRGPAAIVWGDRDPVLGRLRGRVSRALPQAAVTATSAGHFLQEEVPAEIAAAVRGVGAAAG